MACAVPASRPAPGPDEEEEEEEPVTPPRKRDAAALDQQPASGPDTSPTPAREADASGSASDGASGDGLSASGTEVVEAGKIRAGWAQMDIGKEGNKEPNNACPDPEPMITKGTVDYKDGIWTLTGSGEGFIHGWDQGNLVYDKTKVKGDFTFTARVDRFEMVEAGAGLNGAAQAALNVRDGLTHKAPTHSVLTGIAPGSNQFMARFLWSGENKWWYWPAWPNTWPVKKPWPSWIRVQRRGQAFSAFHSMDGTTWQLVEERDANRTWYPFKMDRMADEVYVGLVCTARNDRNYVKQKLPNGCRDPNDPYLLRSARCVFSNVTVSQP